MNTTDGGVITKVVKIGNSHGIRIPKLLIEQCGLRSRVSLTVRDGYITIHPVSQPREGWEEACREMAECGDDRLLDGIALSEWDDTEWEW